MKKLKSLLLLGIILVIGLFALNGCGQKNSSTDSGSKTSNVDPIIFGVPTALGSLEGADSLKAVEMAVEEINNNGGVNVGGQKRPLKIVKTDTREHEPGLPVTDALAAIEKLISQEKPHAMVVGSFRSEVLLSAMDLIAKYKVPNIVTIAMSPKFQEKFATNYDSYKYNFRMSTNAAYLVGDIVATIDSVGKENGYKKAYLVNQDVLWAEGTATGVQKVLESKGWTIVGKDAYPTGASDFSASLTKAKNGGAQVIVPVFDMPQSTVLLKQARSMQVPALFIGSIAPAVSSNSWNAFNGDVDGFVNFVYEVGSLGVKAVPKSLEFTQNYAKKYSEEKLSKLSGHGPSPAYDSVYALVAAIEKANSLEADAIVAALEKTDMEGSVGKIKFDKSHQVIYGNNPAETAIGAAFQWVNGKRVPVYPKAVAESKIQLPSYMK